MVTVNTASLDNHPQFYYTTREKTRHVATVTDRGDTGSSWGGCTEVVCSWASVTGGASSAQGGDPSPEGEDSHMDLPHVSGTVTLTLDGLMGRPQWRGERYLAGVTHSQLIGHEPSGTYTSLAIASNVRRCWNMLKAMELQGTNG